MAPPAPIWRATPSPRPSPRRANAGLESGNSPRVAGNDLPLLQDTTAVNARGAWSAIWRDVISLDRDNVPVGLFSLTAHNLALPAEYAALKQLWIDAAAAP